jgi:sensor histidine kinase YesM
MHGLFHKPIFMSLYFFPRDRQFWLYHCSALAVGLAVTIIIVLMGGYMVLYQISRSLAWLPLYTLAVLGFRWLYKRYSGQTIPMARVIAYAVIYSALAGVALAAVLQMIVLPLFWEDFVAKFTSAGMTPEYQDYLFRTISGEIPVNHMFVLAWSFMYISVTASQRVQKTELNNLRLQNNLKEAQLASLSNQLNPHFLFNSLNNIRFMIHEDAQRADSMIISFSEILRYSLESSTYEKISLDKELAIIEKYIAIVRTQLEERLRFRMRIDSAVHQALVPPMVLQMLVENAIKHGLEQLPAGGMLTLDVHQQGGQLVVKVCNDMPVSTGVPRDGMGIGLRNIGQRLALLYGERAVFDVSRSATEFTVHLSLPLERAL